MEFANVEFLVQAGAVGISLALIGLIYFLVRMIFRLVTNHMTHSDEIMNKLIVVIDSTHKAIDRNTKVTERVERVLDNKIT